MSRLGDELRQARAIRGLSMKAVATEASISTAYLQKLEGDEVKSPSPKILHALSEVLGLSYATLMRLAGYVVPAGSGAIAASSIDQALTTSDLDEEERRAVAAFIAHLRDQRTSKN